jgi:integrase
MGVIGMASFKKLNTGWEYRIKYTDTFTRKPREKSQRGFSTKKEAQLAAAEAEKKIREGIEQSDISLSDFFAVWIKEYKVGTIRKNTIQSHQNNVNTHIIPYFKNILLKDVKPIMYQKFINHVAEESYGKEGSTKTYSKATVRIVHSTFHNAMEKAVTLGKLEKNPCDGVTIKGLAKSNSIKFIESGDIPVFLANAHQYGYIYWIFFKLLLETGMRKGEAAAIQWIDIDLKNQTINVNKTLDFSAKDTEPLFGDTKTFNSPRKLKISQALVNDLKYHMNYQNQNKLSFKGAYHHELNLVLCRDDGNFMPKSSLFNAFSNILKRIELPALPIHSLRHTHAVMLLEAGVEMKYVQERLGHGSIQITSDVYAHISKKIESDSMDKFEKHMKKIGD